MANSSSFLFSPVSPASILKPLLDDLFAGMNIDHPEQPWPRIDELMGNMGRPDHDVPSLHLSRCVTEGKSSPTFLHHKDLFIGMDVQSRTPAGLSLNPEK